jgi:hypothetical protein
VALKSQNYHLNQHQAATSFAKLATRAAVVVLAETMAQDLQERWYKAIGNAANVEPEFPNSHSNQLTANLSFAKNVGKQRDLKSFNLTA